MARLSTLVSRLLSSQNLAMRFIRFVVVGGSNFALTYLVYFLLLRAGMRPGLAILAANVLGILYTSALNARLVFSAKLNWSSLWPQFTYYAIYSLVYASLVEMAVAQHLFRPEIAPLPILAVAIPLNFCVTRFLVLRRPAVEA